MATTNPTTATVNVALATKSQTSAASTRRVETRNDWSVIFNHTVNLIVLTLKGETLAKDCRKGFAFRSVAEAPHSRAYAQSLFAAFCSKKAGKFFANSQHEVLTNEESRRKIAIAILVATALGKSDEAHAKGILSKAEPKQAKTLCEAILSQLAIQQPSAKAETPATNKGTAKAVKLSDAKKKTAHKTSKPATSKK